MINRSDNKRSQRGFSLIELLMSVTISLIILAAGVMTFSAALSSRTREASKTDAVTSTQAALNVMTREIGNSGFGLTTNGIVVADSNNKQLHFRTNFNNDDNATNDDGEDVTFFFDAMSGSVVRFDKNKNGGAGLTSGVVNRISDVEFAYYDYEGTVRTGPNTLPTDKTGRVRIILTVFLPNVNGQPSNQTVKVRSDITLRNAPYMRGQY
jgi:prepilin-type N-terminal cleavage/methylation domain-containing protein